VSLAAPGVDILSTWFLSGLPGSGSAYATLSGTSEAAPHVAGAAALVWARWPGLSADGVMAQLQGSVVDVGQPGRDDETGWGRLDLARALAEPVQPVDLRLSAVAQPDSVIAGNAMTATFTITNTGASPATSVTLSATLPAEPIFEGVHVASSDCSLKGSELRCGIARLDSRAVISMTVVMTPTIVGDGALTTAASANAAQRELTPSDNRQTIITPIRPVLGGRIFLDGNGDGIRQPWETSGIPNAWVLLEQDGQPVAYTSSQSPTGLFQFDMLPSGNYTVIAELPGEYQLTTQGQVEIAVNARLQQTVYIGAWTGQVAPIPGRVYLPVVVAGR